MRWRLCGWDTKLDDVTKRVAVLEVQRKAVLSESYTTEPAAEALLSLTRFLTGMLT